jgi:hypothetical protein
MGEMRMQEEAMSMRCDDRQKEGGRSLPINAALTAIEIKKADPFDLVIPSLCYGHAREPIARECAGSGTAPNIQRTILHIKIALHVAYNQVDVSILREIPDGPRPDSPHFTIDHIPNTQGREIEAAALVVEDPKIGGGRDEHVWAAIVCDATRQKERERFSLMSSLRSSVSRAAAQVLVVCAHCRSRIR